MDHYLDINIVPKKDFTDTVIMNELFNKFHLNMVYFRLDRVGVSFPNRKKNLGNCLRLHGSKGDLEKFMSKSWVGSVTDHITISRILEVPSKTDYCIVRRVQPKSSRSRLLRRSVRKGWISAEEAQKKLEFQKDEITDLPYLRLESHSSGEKFCLFIEHSPEQNSPSFGEFSLYGLSSTATVPVF